MRNMSQKSNVYVERIKRRLVSTQSFTTDDKDIFAGKRFSAIESHHSYKDELVEHSLRARRRSRSAGSELGRWESRGSTEKNSGGDANKKPNMDLVVSNIPSRDFKKSFRNQKKTSYSFDIISEHEEQSEKTIMSHSVNQCPVVGKDENSNILLRNVRKNATLHPKNTHLKKASYKLSRNLTRKMTTRQKQKLMMESEFDEFDDVQHKNDSLSSPEEADFQLSDDSDNDDVDNKLVVQLNMKRIQSDNDLEDSGDEAVNVELSKVQRVADELLATEKSYVIKLHLLDQIFQLNIIRKNRIHNFFPEKVIPQIFSNIKSIYQFHHDFLLPKLEQVISHGSMELKVGEVMAWFAPFLKLYIEYIKNFDRSMDLLGYWITKSPKFSQLIEELQKEPECGNLTLQHHMLEPIQRVPRYELLLKDYLKHLPTSSEDIPHTKKALGIVKEAAQHSNEAMRKIEKFRKLLDVNESLGEIDLISPTRELVKEGKIMRVSARDGSLFERHIFLFNDLLLVCQSGTIKQYKIKSKMNLDDMEVAESHNLETPNCFYVRGREKSIELHTSTDEEKLEWKTIFQKVIDDYQSKLKANRFRMTLMFPVWTDQLGKRAPTWVKDNETSMCMRCAVAFSTFRRRHHCRACGLVVCRMCSSYRTKLEFSDNHEDRVCCFCYEILAKTSNENAKHEKITVVEATKKMSDKLKSSKMRLQVKGSAPSIFSGYMSISCDRKTWTRRWFAVHSNFILFSFKAHQDVVALTSLPLPGYQVKIAEPCEVVQKENMFKVFHEGEKKVYYFQVEDINAFFKWVEVLQSLSKLIVPNTDQPKEPMASP